MHFNQRHALQIILLAGLWSVSWIAILGLSGMESVHALPEYSHRTGEPCGTCHVNPGGGGPRTMRGLLWSAQGRPDQVPVLENVLLAPGVEDPQMLYDIACSGCHGRYGEGQSAVSLVDYMLTEALVSHVVTKGLPISGMPSLAGQLTPEQISSLAVYVTALSNHTIALQDSYPLPPGELGCDSAGAQQSCGGN